MAQSDDEVIGNEATFSMTARTTRGLEPGLAKELEAIGAEKISEHNRAVTFVGDNATMYRANLHLRTALRILKPIYTFHIKTQQDFYRKLYEFQWSDYLRVDDTLAIDTAVHSQIFSNSLFVAMKAKDAIVDQFRQRAGRRPSVDLEQPTIRFHIHIFDRLCTLSLDSSGDSLHKRGYRGEAMQAPINEVLAAGLVNLAGPVPDQGAFVDPMCGAGTIAIEAALAAWNVAPGLSRKRFGFMNWPDYDEALWKKTVAAANQAIFATGPTIYAADVSARAIRIAGENRDRTRLPEGAIQFDIKTFDQYEPPPGPGIVVMNPPYGERLKVKVAASIEDFYAKIGDRLKQSYNDYTAWILSSNIEALKRVGLAAAQKTTLYNGPLECSYRKYELYAGSRKKN
ncbi:MAG: THUMP domain-containing protein [bacterium]|nr:THUMP domain-containing protein [bacterium]